MKSLFHSCILCSLLVSLIVLNACKHEPPSNDIHSIPHDAPIYLHPLNPHYFIYQGSPLVLISSAEHYGAVINGDFDYESYLEELATDQMNLSRIFAGTYVEGSGEFGIKENTLAPRLEALILPWKKTDVPGGNLGFLYDLDNWNPDYFERLKAYIQAAFEKDIIIEVTLFTSYYDNWPFSPLNPINNISLTDTIPSLESQTLQHKALIQYEIAYVEKVAETLKDYPNIIYEIQNEPYQDRGEEIELWHEYAYAWNRNDPHNAEADQLSREWQHQMATAIQEVEKGLDYPHIIAENICNFYCSVSYMDSAINMINFHYANAMAIQNNYHWNVPLGFDESGFAGPEIDVYRRQAWQFMLSGGASFNGLDYSFYVGNEDGDIPSKAPGSGGKALRKQLSYLAEFMGSWDYVNSKPFPSMNISSPGAYPNVLIHANGLLAYLAGPEPSYLALEMPSAKYSIEWLDPINGHKVNNIITHAGGLLKLKCPDHRKEWGIKLERLKE